MKYDYPGNVRELDNIVERATLLARGTVIDLEDLPPTVRPGQRDADAAPKRLPEVLAAIERQAIRDALGRAGGVQTQAAEILGISERVLRYKMKKYGLEGR
ncbi:MAG TPA: helix-turn-helix domain-containing protein [Candidatus Sulfotelmatobacter sp.]|nr:helix-turn-helix domain-containing protein [Candidatus Sulfotelmatobacter sp.]